MLVKIISCEVNEDLKPAFHVAQTKWSKLKSVNGFIAQFGGWNIMDNCEAIIVGFWRSIEDYNYFMSEIHDQIFSESKQEKTYESIEVHLWESMDVLNMNDLKLANYLELADIKNGNLREELVSLGIMQIENDKGRKFVLFQKELGEIVNSSSKYIKLVNDWTVAY